MKTRTSMDQYKPIFLLLTSIYLFEDFQINDESLMLQVKANKRADHSLLHQFVALLNDVTGLEFYIVKIPHLKTLYEVKCNSLTSLFTELKTELLKVYK